MQKLAGKQVEYLIQMKHEFFFYFYFSKSERNILVADQSLNIHMEIVLPQSIQSQLESGLLLY